ncbi:O-antigen ligase family protein [Ochrobactrum sp. CM-21-5]|nr:O-antigen ligase [Ochrobactrum sp. CM-21-5]MBC2887491.1 O-antigen ligase family protein [Ochrobactrum sp. CM-21-5]
MSNIATRTRIESQPSGFTRLDHRLAIRKTALIVAIVVMCILLISFRPFSPVAAENEGARGDVVNQLGFGLLSAAVIAALATLAEPRKIMQIISPGWVLMFVFLFASVLTSADSATAMRGVIFTMIGVVAVVGVLALPQDGDGYARLLMTVATVVIVISYAGVVLLPSLGTHGADAHEPQNSFLWRGVFSHKNVAGPVMAALAFAGLYLWRRRWRISGTVIGLAALFFVAQTGSKTTMALVPFSMLLVVVPGLMGLRFLTVATIFVIQLSFGIFTFGAALFEPIRNFVESLNVDATFTGRVSIWKFALEALWDRPWSGYGYESFWNSPFAREAANPYYLDWDVRKIVHAHNGYLDIAVSMGIPALVCGIAVIIIMPLVNYVRCRPQRENLLLADFFLMVVFFGTLNAMLESFFFRRVDPVWLILIFAIFGLRLTAKVVIPRRSGAGQT